MAKQVIGVGSAANDGNGDAIRDAFIKCNENFTELYNVGAVAPRLIMADKIWGVEDDSNTLQIFKRGILEAPDPYFYHIQFTGLADAYRPRSRYLHVPATTAVNHSSFTVTVQNAARQTIATKTLSLQIVTAVSQPASDTRVLFIGDSLTMNSSGAYPTEFNRLLTGTGGTPAGKEYGNITLIGTQGTGSNLHEGHTGRTWAWFVDPSTSPFANAGGTALDFNYYITNNSFGGLEQVYILLGWNHLILGQGGPLASDWAGQIADMEELCDAILADYPSCKITLVSMQVPGKDSSNGNLDIYSFTRRVFGYKLAIKSVADNPTYSSNVDWIDLACQFDSEFNMPNTAVVANSRTAATETIVSDPIHPNADGYKMIADAAYRHFIANWCQG